MSSVGPGAMPGHWTCPLADHWEIPDSSMSMTNEHVGFFCIEASALVNASLQIFEALGHCNYCQWVQVWCSKLLHIEKTKWMNYTFSNTINGGGALKSKVIFLPQEVGSDLPVTMWYFELPLELFAKSLWDPQVMKDFACFPQRKYTDCGSHVYDKITSADWFYEAFNNSPVTESEMLWLQSKFLFVGIGQYLMILQILTIWWRTQSILSYKPY